MLPVGRAGERVNALLWKVRTTLADRPGALAALAGRCGENGVNILSLQIFPHLGSVTDEVLLSVPGNWDAEEVRALVAASGGDLVAVGRCSERDLVDAPTKYLRTALQLLDRPYALAEALGELLGVDGSAQGGDEEDVLSVEVEGSSAEVKRPVPFTEVERARAAVLTEFARWALSRSEPDGDIVDAPCPVSPLGATATVRRAGPSDATVVRRLHERCSTETLSRRFHSPTTRLSRRWERRLLEPDGGASFVAAVGDEVVGMVVIAPYEDDVVEVGVLVEDGWQRKGIGSTLLHAAATHAAGLQKTAMFAIMEPDNRALLPTIRRCGLQCHVRTVDGTAHVTIPLTRFTGDARNTRAEPAAPRYTAETSDPPVAVRIG
ncbi:GNAT family N-acetyltransferase [Nocardioides immobilis]|uniref:GNAT family N-acetyltransferase n=1 Tax=Nocardioides immobilis TaxID=2049295 RepID=A0A417Y377_9ACTN|nr:GNAT family N-acetyltransferase [Nocardioides immobilis]RHW27031.1 GNAT family N-acetyltransferase [Nocardioides immobilis]